MAFISSNVIWAGFPLGDQLGLQRDVASVEAATLSNTLLLQASLRSAGTLVCASI